MEAIDHDLVILGGGPAGLTAGLYAARSRLDVVLLEGKACGGQLMTYESVENYPGFPEGIGAPELVRRMVEQATRFGLKILNNQVLSVEVSADKSEKTIILKDGAIRCKSIIVATEPMRARSPSTVSSASRARVFPTVRPVTGPFSRIASYP